jgi:thymidylate kinase
VDRFHISTQAYQLMTHGRRYDFGWLEDRLAALNFRLVFLTRSPESFAAALERRLLVSGKPSQYDDLNMFVREQEVLADLVAASRLTTLTVDVSESDVPATTERIVDWMEATGGLWLA